MQFRGDRRGQAIQIGAVLLLGAIVISFGIYQATVVPEQNREIEFKHSQTVQGQLGDARNAIVSTGSTGDGRSVSVTLGTQYPSRIIAMNPGPPSGQLSTVGTTNGSITATIANAEATGETGDFWTGENRSYNTGSLAYRPGYNEYRNAPTTWYEHSVLFNQFRDANLTETGQRLIDGTTISLVALNGSYQASQSGSVSLDFRGASVSSRTVSVTNETDSNVSIALPTRLDEQSWEEVLDGERRVANVRTSSVAGADYHLVHIVLEQGVIYDLQLSRVGVGTGVVKPEPAYLTRVSENTPTVPEDGEIDITVEVRDRFDNPKRNVPVVAGTERSGSSVSPNSTASDGDGQVTVTYEAPNISDAGQRTDYVQVSLNASLSGAVNESGFNGSTPVNVSVPVRVDNSDGSGLSNGGSGGDSAYSIDWYPDTSQDGFKFNESRKVYVVDAGKTDSVNLPAITDPVAQNATVDFTLNNSIVGEYNATETDATTDSIGNATAVFEPKSNGSVIAFVASGGSGDSLTIVIENMTADSAPSDLTLDAPTSEQVRQSSESLDVTYGYSDDNPDTVTVTFDDNSGNTATYTIDDSAYAGDNSEKTVSLDLSNPDSTSGNGFVDGNTYDITVKVTNAAGLSSSDTEGDLLTIDEGKPTSDNITATTNKAGNNDKKVSNVTFNYDVEDNVELDSITLYVNETKDGSVSQSVSISGTSAQGTETLSFEETNVQGEGTSLSVKAVIRDAGGNQLICTATMTGTSQTESLTCS